MSNADQGAVPESISAGTVRLFGSGGDAIEAYRAEPADASPVGGIVVLHHMPGWDEHTKQVTRRFAEEGYLAICPNLYSREAPGRSPEDAFAIIWAAGGVDDDQVVGDARASADHLALHPASNGKIAVIGFCSGGRQALLVACNVPLAAAIDCYGSFVVEPPDPKLGLRFAPIVHLVDGLSCPLLGLFGDDDHNPAPAEVAALADALTAAGKTFEFHSHADAGHAFLATNRPTYRPAAAAAGWEQISAFLAAHIR